MGHIESGLSSATQLKAFDSSSTENVSTIKDIVKNQINKSVEDSNNSVVIEKFLLVVEKELIFNIEKERKILKHNIIQSYLSMGIALLLAVLILFVIYHCTTMEKNNITGIVSSLGLSTIFTFFLHKKIK